MTGRPDWRPSALLATTVVGIGLAAVLAALTIDAPPLPARQARSKAAPPAAPAAEVALPTAAPPPTLSASDFRTTAPSRTDSAPAAPAPPPAPAARPGAPADLATLPVDDLRIRANANELPAMEELARRLIQGAGVAKDPQAGAGWLLRAAEAGSPQAAFNVGVMYERGFVVERDSSKAVEWYRKAADGGMPAARHNLALMLRDGKGAPRDVKRALEFLRMAARQGMAASMFMLGDIYERGDTGTRDPASALAWFAITAEFERQINRGETTPLARTADQRAQALQQVLAPAELQRAQQLGQAEYQAIAEALAPPKADPPAASNDASSAANAPAPPPVNVDLPSWPKAPADQVRAIQQALVDLKLLRDKPDGTLGPMTRNAIRDFQRSAGLQETGEPSKELYVVMREAQARRILETRSPLPLPPPASTGPAATATAPSTADPDVWPADGSEQVKAIQRLLRDLKMFADPIDGQLGPRTQAAIVQYERLSGLKENGQPTRALFDSLKETRALMAPKPGSN